MLKNCPMPFRMSSELPPVGNCGVSSQLAVAEDCIMTNIIVQKGKRAVQEKRLIVSALFVLRERNGTKALDSMGINVIKIRILQLRQGLALR